MKSKNKYLALLLVLLTTLSCAQEKYIAAEGYYDQSGFEMAGGLYLLKNKLFYYSASFGNADLIVFGVYEISLTNVLTFHPNNILMNEFNVYGTTNEVKTDSLILFYKEPYRKYAENLVVKTDINSIAFPEFTSASRTVSTTIKKPKSKQIELEFVNSGSYGNQKNFKIELNDSINEALIYHNYYAQMATDFSRTSLKIEDGNLIGNKQKKVQKKEINEKTIKDVISEIERKRFRLKTPFTKDKKEYWRLNIIQ